MKSTRYRKKKRAFLRGGKAQELSMNSKKPMKILGMLKTDKRILKNKISQMQIFILCCIQGIIWYRDFFSLDFTFPLKV